MSFKNPTSSARCYMCSLCQHYSLLLGIVITTARTPWAGAVPSCTALPLTSPFQKSNRGFWQPCTQHMCKRLLPSLSSCWLENSASHPKFHTNTEISNFTNKTKHLEDAAHCSPLLAQWQWYSNKFLCHSPAKNRDNQALQCFNKLLAFHNFLLY